MLFKWRLFQHIPTNICNELGTITILGNGHCILDALQRKYQSIKFSIYVVEPINSGQFKTSNFWHNVTVRQACSSKGEIVLPSKPQNSYLIERVISYIQSVLHERGSNVLCHVYMLVQMRTCSIQIRQWLKTDLC